MENDRLIIFNVTQGNLARCLEFSETAIRRKSLPNYVLENEHLHLLCVLRQTYLEPQKYGAVGLYRIDRTAVLDPKKPISGWSPSSGWTHLIRLDEVFRFPNVFHEDFCKITSFGPKIKESRYANGLLNWSIQGAVVILPPVISSNYLEALRDRYPQIRL